MAEQFIEVHQVGANKLSDLGKALRAAGAKDLRKELLAAMQRTAKPLKAAGRRAAAERLPHSGGLADRVASGKFTARTSTSAKSAGVRIVAKAGMDLPAMDRGRLRHPVYGTGAWVSQNIQPGWFSGALEEQAPAVRVELLAAIDEVAQKLEARL
jgi:hypothetical protein